MLDRRQGHKERLVYLLDQAKEALEWRLALMKKGALEVHGRHGNICNSQHTFE